MCHASSRHRAGPSCGPQSKCALRNSLEVVQLLLPHVLSFHSPACSGVGAVISILHMRKLRLVASPGPHSESLMGLGLAASFPSTGAMTAKGRSSKPRVQWVGGHLGAPHRLGFTGLGLSAASGAWWTEGGGAGEGGSWKRQASLRNLTPFSRTPSPNSHGSGIPNDFSILQGGLRAL